MSKRLFFLGSLMAVALTGCQKEQVRSYSVPKEDHSMQVASGHGPGDGHGHDAEAEPARPHVHWELPEGWEERKADSMSLGRFRIAGDGGKLADVVVMPMPGAARMPNLEEQSVEMWKSSLGASSTNTPAPEKVEIAGGEGRLYDLTGTNGRLIAGILEKEGTLWFVRMSGDGGVVGTQQEAFRAFLKSLSIHEESHDAAPAAAVEARWPAAEGWTAQAPGQMVLAAYSVGGKATVTVTSFPGDVGGLLANVNRWRGQAGLGPTTEAELPKLTKEIALPDGTKATAVEIQADAKSSYTLVVPRAGNTWFYKIVGDAATIAGEKERLAEFAAKAK